MFIYSLWTTAACGNRWHMDPVLRFMGNLPHVLLIWGQLLKDQITEEMQKATGEWSIKKESVKQKKHNTAENKAWKLSKTLTASFQPLVLSTDGTEQDVTVGGINICTCQKWSCLNFTPSSDIPDTLVTADPWTGWTNVEWGINCIAQIRVEVLRGNFLRCWGISWPTVKVASSYEPLSHYGTLQLVFIFDTILVKPLFVAGFQSKALCFLTGS